MKVLMIDAGPKPVSTTSVALLEVKNALAQEGIDSEILYIGSDEIAICKFCGQCAATHRCVTKDIVNCALEKSEQADAYIFATQGHYGAANGYLAAFIHRFLQAGKHTNKPVASVVTCRRSGGTAALAELNSFFTMKSMPIVSSTYWNVLLGTKPEDIQNDAEGLRTMRNLARNFAWILRCIEVGRNAGIPAPQHE